MLIRLFVPQESEVLMACLYSIEDNKYVIAEGCRDLGSQEVVYQAKWLEKDRGGKSVG